jgi:hypothetical protein
MTCDTSGKRLTVYSPIAPDFIRGFNWARVVQYLVFCVVLCRFLNVRLAHCVVCTSLSLRFKGSGCHYNSI